MGNLKQNINKQFFTTDNFISGEFKTIYYADIDLDNSEVLLKKQGLLTIELKWLKAYTLIALLKQEDKIDSYTKFRPSLIYRLLTLIFDFFYLIPLILFSSNISILHCIYVNNCKAAQWKKLPNGYYQFILT